jgi:hypothetical protein
VVTDGQMSLKPGSTVIVREDEPELRSDAASSAPRPSPATS